MQLTEEDHTLVKITVRSLWRRNRSNYIRLGYELDDLMNTGYEALMLAVKRHDPSKGPLHYWKRVYIKGYTLNVLNRTPERLYGIEKVTLGLWANTIADEELDLERFTSSPEATYLKGLVNKHAANDIDIEAVRVVYLQEIDRHSYARQLGITKSAVDKRVTRGRKKLYEHLQGEKSTLERWCEDCDADISHRHGNASLCEDCGVERSRQKVRDKRGGFAQKEITI